jgi:hypothetical protein
VGAHGGGYGTMKAPANAASPSGTRLTRGWEAAGTNAATRNSNTARMSRASRKGDIEVAAGLGSGGRRGSWLWRSGWLRRVGLGSCSVGFDAAGQRVELLDGGLCCGVACADLTSEGVD